MRRRKFISLIGLAATMWPLAAGAQQGERIRRICLLMAFLEQDNNARPRVAALLRALEELGWVEGHNMHVTYGYAGIGHARLKKAAQLLITSPCDVIVVHSNPGVIALREVDRKTPSVFVEVGDPVGNGFVEGLSHPGGNLTGFSTAPPEMAGKWLELIKEIAPATNHVVAIFDPKIKANINYLQSAKAAVSAYKISFGTVAVQSASEIERAVTALARVPHSALMIIPSPLVGKNRGLIARLTTTYSIPSIYSFRQYPKQGGLMSYGPDEFDLFRRAASYVDRILRGSKPADLPIQRPTKFEFVINLKTAKALGLTVAPTLLARADAVVE
jgi:putative ABC transport system substrate-binding protein